MVDFGSLLLASALSGICLSLTLASIWYSSRSEYVLSMAGGISLLVFHIIGFWQYGQHASPWLGEVVLSLLIAGFFVIYCSAMQYLNVRHNGAAELIAGFGVLGVISAVALGYDGAGFIIGYTSTSALLAMTGFAFWVHGDHDHRILLVVSLLSSSCGVSFFLCGAVLVWNGQWQLGTTPDNWAERINTVLAVACMTGLGALTLSLHNLRTRNELVTDTMTDPLTGLMNRRALQTIHGEKLVGRYTAIAMFDLDNFKKTNDVFGHPVGDLVLKRFGATISRYAGKGIDVFRLGGEEFCAVMTRVEPARAREITERIGVSFGAEVVHTPLGPLRSTVSAGVASGTGNGLPLDDVIALADAALYEAKRAGRNCVMLSDSLTRRHENATRSA